MAKRFISFFFWVRCHQSKMALVVLVFNFIWNNFVRLYVTAVVSACIWKKNLPKLVNFCIVILLLKMEEKKQNFQHIMLYHFKKGNTTKMQKYICAVYGEDATTDRACQSSLWSFVLEISYWTMLHSWVYQLKLIVIKSRYREQSMLYHAGDSWHTQNIRIEPWKPFAPSQLC